MLAFSAPLAFARYLLARGTHLPVLCSDILISFRKPNTAREHFFWLFSLKLTDITYDSDAHEILELAMSNTFCAKVAMALTHLENCCHRNLSKGRA